MFNKRSNAADPGRAPKRKRYWSVMLVGEHGRVIPFKHFKGLVIAVAVALVLSQLAAAVIGIAYYQKHRTVQRLEQEMGDLRQQTAALRDEKDVLLAKMVIDKVQTPSREKGATTQKSRVETVRPESAAPPATVAPTEQQSATKTPTPAPVSRVRWQADVRNFEVSFAPRQQVLEAVFRIYNTTSPRQMLSGNIVVVFRKNGDPAVPPLPVPNVTLRNGQPLSSGGQEFRINNYRTMRFRAERQNAPIAYDTVSVFVYEAGGDLLLTRNFDIDIPTPPAPAPQPALPEAQWPASPVEEPESAVDPQWDNAAGTVMDSTGTTGPSGPADEPPTLEDQPDPVPLPPDSTGTGNEAAPPEYPETRQPEATMEGDDSEGGSEEVLDY